MRKLIIAAIMGVAAVLGAYGATLASGAPSHTIADSEADLAITRHAAPGHIQVGAHLTYKLLVKNNGPASSTGVILEDALPDKVTFVSAESTSGTCSESGGEVTCNIGTLQHGESAIATITVVADHTGRLINTISVHGDQSDPIAGNNTVEIVVSVVKSATGMRVDIKPGSEHNNLNPRSRSMLPVAILGSADFDVREISMRTIRMGVEGDSPRRTAPEHRRRNRFGDVNGDGFADLKLHFRTQKLGIARNVQRGDTVTLSLSGEMADGTKFRGRDTVTIVGNAPSFRGLMEDGNRGRGRGSDNHSDYDNNEGGHQSEDEGRGNGSIDSHSSIDEDDDEHPSSNGKGRGRGRGRGGR